MRTLLFLVEERSMKTFLEGLLPRLLTESMMFECIPFEGKQDLEKQMVRKLRGWQRPDTRFFVVRDQDSADCVTVKARLRAKCVEAKRPEATIRIACRELEAWYLGDPVGLARAYDRQNIADIATKTKYRDPDELGSPAHELSLLVPEFQKVDGARRMGPLIDVDTSTSTSFRHFVASVRRATR